MRKLLLPMLLAFGVVLTGAVDASAARDPGITKKVTTNVSRMRLATHQCRIVTKGDQRTKKCDQVDVCR
jgi:hypothetical protein